MDRRRFAWWHYVVTYSAVLVVVVASISYTNYVDRRTRADLCEAIVAQGNAYVDPQPVTPTGRQAGEALARLKILFQCSDGKD